MADVQVTDLAETLEIDDVDFLHVKNGSTGIDEKFLWSRMLLPINKGGTGATTAEGARTNLNVYSKEEALAASDYTPTNGIIDGRLDFWYEGETSSTQGYSSSTTFFSVFDGTVSSTREDLALTSQVVVDNPTARYCKEITVTAAGTAALERTVIPNVRNYAGKTVTVSLYLEADSAQDVAIELCQDFGTTGSARVTGIGSQLVSITDTFARYDVQINVPNLVGKTIDTDSYLELNIWLTQDGTYNARTANLSNQTGVVRIACVQLVSGSVASKFDELDDESALSMLNRNFQFIKRIYHYLDSGNAMIDSHLLSTEMIADPNVSVGSTSLELNVSTATLTSNSNTLESTLSPASAGFTRVRYNDITLDSRLGDTTI
jgi:hypothetical protein